MQNLVTKIKANYIYKITIYLAIPTFRGVFFYRIMWHYEQNFTQQKQARLLSGGSHLMEWVTRIITITTWNQGMKGSWRQIDLG